MQIDINKDMAINENDIQTNPINLLKVLTSYYSGGTEGQVLNLATSLNQREFNIQFACLRKGGDILNEFEALGCPITEFQIKNLYCLNTILQQVRFAGFLRKNNIQIVHSYNFYSNVFTIPAAKMAGIPIIFASIRDRGVYLTPAQKLVQKWVCKLADKILVNAESIREWLIEQGYEDKKIEVIKNGIDLSNYSRVRGSENIRKDLGIPESAPLVLMLSRLNKQKGVEDFIDAAAIISKTHPDVKFLIVGAKLQYIDGIFSEDTQYRRELEKRAKSIGIKDKVIFAGMRKDVPSILAEVDISVLPSYSEGMSNTVLESMAAGIPVVTTNVGGNPELIKDDINGYLVPVNSPQLIANALIRILDDPALANRLSKQAKETAENNFSLEKMSLETGKLYKQELKKEINILY